MSGSKSKRKGSSWELAVANYLSDLYKEKFIRVPHSGAFVGGKNASRKEELDSGQIRGLKGDIIPPSEWVRFNCEAKSYADFPFHQLLLGKCLILERWLDQITESAEANDFNILIMKFNRKGQFVACQNPIVGKHYMAYTSKKHGLWYVQEFEAFWEINRALVKEKSIG